MDGFLNRHPTTGTVRWSAIQRFRIIPCYYLRFDPSTHLSIGIYSDATIFFLLSFFHSSLCLLLSSFEVDVVDVVFVTTLTVAFSSLRSLLGASHCFCLLAGVVVVTHHHHRTASATSLALRFPVLSHRQRNIKSFFSLKETSRA